MESRLSWSTPWVGGHARSTARGFTTTPGHDPEWLGAGGHGSDALLAARERIRSKPHASAGRGHQQEAATHWRASSEYCAWVYYTPDEQDLVSRLTDQAALDPHQRVKTCLLPTRVEDSRYPPDSLRYIHALHNHPFGSELSRGDIRFIVEHGALRGFETKAREGIVRRWRCQRTGHVTWNEDVTDFIVSTERGACFDNDAR